MKRFIIPFFTFAFAFALLSASAVTATKEYVDRQDGATLQAAKDYTDEQSFGINTNAVRDIVREQLATNGIRSVDGAAKMLPKYLWQKDFDDSYPDAAQEYYRSRGDGKVDGGCSAVRSGGYLYRNFDYPLDDRAEFIVRMSAGPSRFASVGVAQVGTNLTEEIVTSGKPSPCYKWLPGATVDGINENGVVAEINVVDGDPQTSGWHNDTGDLNPLAAVRWALDNGTSAGMVASNLASRIAFPAGWTQNFHYMIADERETWIVENGMPFPWEKFLPSVRPVLTNFKILGGDPGSGSGYERAALISEGSSITNAWYTRAYRRETTPPWVSDLAEVIDHTNEIFTAWATHPKEYFRGKTSGGQPWWQSVHTSVYDLTNRVLRVAVQETDDWYTFAVPSTGGTDEEKVREIAFEVVAPVATKVSDLESTVTGLESSVSGLESSVSGLESSVSGLQSSKLDKADVIDPAEAEGTGKAADAKATKDALDALDTAHRAALAVKLDKNSANGTGVIDWDNDNGWLNIDYWPLNIGWNSVIYIGANTLAWNNWQITAPVTVYDSGGFTFGRGNILKFSDHGGSESTEYETIDERIVRLAPTYVPSAIDPTFSNEVLKVQMLSLSTNITEEVYIAATNACANLGIDPALIPGAGTTGTVGGFIAMLFVVVFWMRKKIFDNSGKVNDTFAGELMGKQVANVKANTVSLAAAYSETATYAVGDAVTYNGKLYKCAVAITTAEAWTPAHWTETTVANLWNNADTTSYGGQN